MSIGIFDSGVGGLTVVRALRAALPSADLVYLGDTARLPYGTKSSQTVISYARQAADYLHRYDLQALVIACNTATAHALSVLVQSFPGLAVMGVIAPGAQAAAQYQRVLVLATEGTIASGAYTAAIHAHNPSCAVTGVPATLLVALAEEGWGDGAEAEAILRRYLMPYLVQQPEAIVLGCTHFPLLLPALRAVVGEQVTLIDSAQTTAAALSGRLGRVEGQGTLELLATDNPARFARVASLFLGQPVHEQAVRLIDAGLGAAVEPA